MVVHLVNTQDNLPEHQLQLPEVGISNLKTLITIKRQSGKHFRFIATVDVTINLPAERKGAHMSRLVESISETFSDVQSDNDSIEMLNKRALLLLKQRHPFLYGSITLKFDFAWYLKTPVSNRETIEVYPIEFKTELHKNEKFVHRVSITASGNTACPHALAVAEGKRTHVQRALGTLTVVGMNRDIPDIEDIISVVESSFSSPTFSVLKTEDEAWVVSTMFDQPYFVEDVARNILVNADNTFTKMLNFHSFVRSEESIHKHDVIARGSIIRDESLEKSL